MDEDGHEPTRPSLDQVMSDAVLVVIAGSDTTSTILGNIVFNLVSHPEVYLRLREEVDHYFPPGEADDVIIDSAKMAEMPYLNAVMCVVRYSFNDCWY
jgi:cytochrome P450